MPVFNKTIEYFTCQFKCGSAAKPLPTMEKHEKKCFCNPETRSCRICKHYIVDPYFVHCDLLKLRMDNREKDVVCDDKTGRIVYDGKVERIKMTDIFYQPQERPFPKSNCMQFEQGKKAY